MLCSEYVSLFKFYIDLIVNEQLSYYTSHAYPNKNREVPR